VWLTKNGRISPEAIEMGCHKQSRHCLSKKQGKAVAERCTEYHLTQPKDSQWPAKFLPHAGQAFEVYQPRQREIRMQQENAGLKRFVGGFFSSHGGND